MSTTIVLSFAKFDCSRQLIAIKEIRRLTGESLTDAKDIVDKAIGRTLLTYHTESDLSSDELYECRNELTDIGIDLSYVIPCEIIMPEIKPIFLVLSFASYKHWYGRTDWSVMLTNTIMRLTGWSTIAADEFLKESINNYWGLHRYVTSTLTPGEIEEVRLQLKQYGIVLTYDDVLQVETEPEKIILLQQYDPAKHGSEVTDSSAVGEEFGAKHVETFDDLLRQLIIMAVNEKRDHSVLTLSQLLRDGSY